MSDKRGRWNLLWLQMTNLNVLMADCCSHNECFLHNGQGIHSRSRLLASYLSVVGAGIWTTGGPPWLFKKNGIYSYWVAGSLVLNWHFPQLIQRAIQDKTFFGICVAKALQVASGRHIVAYASLLPAGTVPKAEPQVYHNNISMISSMWLMTCGLAQPFLYTQGWNMFTSWGTLWEEASFWFLARAVPKWNDLQHLGLAVCPHDPRNLLAAKEYTFSMRAGAPRQEHPAKKQHLRNTVKMTFESKAAQAQLRTCEQKCENWPRNGVGCSLFSK